MSRLVLFLFLFFSSVYSFANNKEFFSPELAAKTTAELLNRSETFEGFIEQISPMLSTSEVEGVRSLLTEMKIQLSTATPKFTVKGNAVILGKQDPVRVAHTKIGILERDAVEEDGNLLPRDQFYPEPVMIAVELKYVAGRAADHDRGSCGSVPRNVRQCTHLTLYD